MANRDTKEIIDPTQLPPLPLPNGITSRFVDTSPFGLKFHILESVPPNSPSERPPLILLVHGFPNLAYDWRYVMPALAAAGYYVVAFDQRGFGRTHNADLSPLAEATFRPLVLARDVVTLVQALGYTSIHTLVGHDLGAATSAFSTLVRGDMIKSLVLMCHTFHGPPKLPFGTSSSDALPAVSPPARSPLEALRDPNIHASLLKLDPPRKHYKWYNASAHANSEWSYPQGEPLQEFLRGYFHLKSGAYSGNNPRVLKSWTAEELSVMPHYYVMRADLSMRENIALDMSQEPDEIRKGLSSTPWLSDAELAVYTQEWSRTTFEDSLRWYSVLTDPRLAVDLLLFSSSKIQIPTKYISGVRDWGTYQDPGGLQAMEEGRSVQEGSYRGTVLIEGAGHWVNMEKPNECVKEILDLADSCR